jgi:hypothetical protein
MEDLFNADAWEKLTTEERIQQSRLFASETYKLGRGSVGRMKPLYLDLSTQWSMLADEMERQISKKAV